MIILNKLSYGENVFYIFMFFFFNLVNNIEPFNLSMPSVTVQCTKDAQFIVVVARDVTLPNIDLESISLLEQGQGCTHVDSNSDYAIYQFPVTACGSLVMVRP